MGGAGGAGPDRGPWLGHRYGERVRILDCPWTNACLAKLSNPDCTYTELVAAVRGATARLCAEVFRLELPRAELVQPTRMAAAHGPRGVWRGDAFAPDMDVVVLDVIRGGMVPAQTCFEMLSLVHPQDRLRLDHLNMERVAGGDGHVERVDLSGSKIGGSTAGAIVLVPDPMGATGATVRRAFGHLVEHHGRPDRIVAMPLIATPEFLRAVLELGPEARVYAGRLDRGASPQDVLEDVPGARWDEESGLDADDYIVPGAGGVGELLNNSWT